MRIARDIGKPRFDDRMSPMSSPTATGAHDEELLEVFKALSNPTRLQILRWLAEPEANFAAQEEPAAEVGVCVKQIQEKAGISQSTASQFMGVLQRAGLVSSRRIGRWTYFKRDTDRIGELPAMLRDGL
jgi:DNA-binding transcriptional ArsR family regulator